MKTHPAFTYCGYPNRISGFFLAAITVLIISVVTVITARLLLDRVEQDPLDSDPVLLEAANGHLHLFDRSLGEAGNQQGCPHMLTNDGSIGDRQMGGESTMTKS